MILEKIHSKICHTKVKQNLLRETTKIHKEVMTQLKMKIKEILEIFKMILTMIFKRNMRENNHKDKDQCKDLKNLELLIMMKKQITILVLKEISDQKQQRLIIWFSKEDKAAISQL